MFRFDASTGDLVESKMETVTASGDGETKSSEPAGKWWEIHWKDAGDRLPPNLQKFFKSLMKPMHHKVTYRVLKEAREEVTEVCGPVSSREEMVKYFFDNGNLEMASALEREFKRVVRADTKLGLHLEAYKAILRAMDEALYTTIATFFVVTHFVDMADKSTTDVRAKHCCVMRMRGTPPLTSIADIEVVSPLLEKVGPDVNLTRFIEILRTNHDIGREVNVISRPGPYVSDVCWVRDDGQEMVSDGMAVITGIPEVRGHIQRMTIETKTGSRSIRVYAHDFPIFVPVNCVFRLKTVYEKGIDMDTEVEGYNYFGCTLIPHEDSFRLGNLRYTSIESPGSTATGMARAMSIECITDPTRFETKCVLKELQRRIKSPTDVCWMHKHMRTFTPLPGSLFKVIHSYDDKRFQRAIRDAVKDDEDHD